jgi:hypothetical protein
MVPTDPFAVLQFPAPRRFSLRPGRRLAGRQLVAGRQTAQTVRTGASPTPRSRFRTREWTLKNASDFLAFSNCGRIGGRPKETEKERPEGPLWAAKPAEKGVSRPKVWAAERGENEAITRQNPPLGEAGFQRQRMFR